MADGRARRRVREGEKGARKVAPRKRRARSAQSEETPAPLERMRDEVMKIIWEYIQLDSSSADDQETRLGSQRLEGFQRDILK